MRNGLLAIAVFSGAVGTGVFAPVGQTAQAASFDCSRARRADETAICASRSLQDADVKMSTTYAMVLQLVGMGVRGDLQDSQRTWLTDRGRCGANAGCIAQSYRTRQQRLDAVFQNVVRQGPF